MIQNISAFLSSSLLASAAATLAFCPLLIVSFAMLQPMGGRIETIENVMSLSALVLMVSPVAFFVFFLGAVLIGPVSFAISNAAGLANSALAMTVAMTSTALAAWLLLGRGVGNGNVEVVAPLAISGALGGWTLYGAAEQLLKPPPAQPS